MSQPRQIPLVILGAGRVSAALLRQLAATHAHLSQRYGIWLLPVALADSSGALFNPRGFNGELEAVFQAKRQGQPLAEHDEALGTITPLDLIKHVHDAGVSQAIVVDATAAEGMESMLHHSLDLGYGIVLANKRPLAGPWPGIQRFFETSYARFEATVGAGLPIINTLRYLVDTGDDVRYIEGMLSRTLGYICTRLEDGEAFSSAVYEAAEKGFTESDLREDLGGMDVARKALILARLVGWPLELADIRVSPLYQSEMLQLDSDSFMSALPRLNAQYAAYMGASTGVPRYVAEIHADKGVVALRMVNKLRASQLRGPVNQIAVTTRRYADYPLTLAGPGEGIEVTAAAVLQDCTQLALRIVQG